MLILLITLDCVRADRVGAGLTPQMNGLDPEWTSFSQAFSHCQHTLPSHLSMLSSNYLFQHGVYSNLHRKELPAHTLPRRLSGLGFDVQAWVSTDFLSIQLADQIGEKDPRFPPLEARTMGDKYHRLLRRIKGHRRPGEDTLKKGLHWLSRTGRRRDAFLWLHLFDSHMVYSAPDRFLREHVAPGRADRALRSEIEGRGWWAPDFPEFGRRLPVENLPTRYDAAVAYQDACLGNFFGELKARGWWEDALVVVTADHGECLLGEHGIYCAHKKLFDETTHVPLKVKFPRGRLAGQRVSGIVQHVDIAPTVATVAGFQEPLYQGLDLAAVAEGRTSPHAFAFAEHEENILRAVRDDTWLLVKPTPGVADRWNLPPDDASLFLRQGVPAPEQHASHAARLESHMEAILASGLDVREAWSGSEVSEEERLAEQLKGLGYM